MNTEVFSASPSNDAGVRGLFNGEMKSSISMDGGDMSHVDCQGFQTLCSSRCRVARRRLSIGCSLLLIVASPVARAADEAGRADQPAGVQEQRVAERGSPVEKMAAYMPESVDRNAAGEVVGLRVASAAGIDDRDIAALKDLPHLSELRLQVSKTRSSLTDEGLKALAELKTLRKATIVSCGSLPGRSAIEAIGVPPQLKELRLTLAEFAGERHVLDDELMASLKNLTSLEVLWATQRSNLGDRDLEWVEKARSLHTLHLSVDHVSAKAMQRLAGLRQLRTLVIRSKHVDPAGVPELSKLENLKWLELTSDDLSTDGFADVLSKLPNLRNVRLHGKKIDPSALFELQMAIPNVRLTN
jgi:hypothetical protein